MAKKLLSPWACFHTIKHHIKLLLQRPCFLIRMYLAEYFWVLSITESARGCCEQASFCINMFEATYRNPLGSLKRIQQAVHQPQTWVQRKTVCHHLSCSCWGLVFLLMPLSGNHVSSHLYFLLLSLPYLMLSVCHLMLRTYFTATTDHASGCPVIKNDDLSGYIVNDSQLTMWTKERPACTDNGDCGFRWRQSQTKTSRPWCLYCCFIQSEVLRAFHPQPSKRAIHEWTSSAA